jgi:putative heme iron utilization protein
MPTDRHADRDDEIYLENLWAKHAARMVDIRHANAILDGIHGRGHLADLCIDERVILELVIKMKASRTWVGYMRLKMA